MCNVCRHRFWSRQGWHPSASVVQPTTRRHPLECASTTGARLYCPLDSFFTTNAILQCRVFVFKYDHFSLVMILLDRWLLMQHTHTHYLCLASPASGTVSFMPGTVYVRNCTFRCVIFDKKDAWHTIPQRRPIRKWRRIAGPMFSISSFIRMNENRW